MNSEHNLSEVLHNNLFGLKHLWPKTYTIPGVRNTHKTHKNTHSMCVCAFLKKKKKSDNICFFSLTRLTTWLAFPAGLLYNEALRQEFKDLWIRWMVLSYS